MKFGIYSSIADPPPVGRGQHHRAGGYLPGGGGTCRTGAAGGPDAGRLGGRTRAEAAEVYGRR